MDFKKLENLVLESKMGNINSKEEILKEFKPFIVNVCRKTFIFGFSQEDLQNECYVTILHSIELYNTNTHRFVAYATNAVKNNLNYIIKKNIIRKPIEGSEALNFSNGIEETLICDCSTEDIVIEQLFENKLIQGINLLNQDDKELIHYIYVKNNSLRKYSKLKNIPYSTLFRKHVKLLLKLKKYME